MDTFTHAMTGMAVAAAATRERKLLAPAIVTGALAGLFPDLDAVTAGIDYFLDTGYYNLHHRLFTHNLFIAPLLILVAALPGWRWAKGNFRFFLLVSLAGIFSHLCLDEICHWPLRLFYPLSTRQFQIPIVGYTSPVFCLAVTAIFIGTVIWKDRKWKTREE